MTSFKFQKTTLEGLIRIDPVFVPDMRGYTHKIFDQKIFTANGIDFSPCEELRTCSKKGVVRGIHFQHNHNQDKLVHVISGAVYDVAVDLREGSDTFGQWEGFWLSGHNRVMIYIPRGFAHGFLALQEDTVLSYLIGDQYDPASDDGIKWDDPDLGVDWPLDRVEKVILSEKDSTLPSFNDFKKHYGALPQRGKT